MHFRRTLSFLLSTFVLAAAACVDADHEDPAGLQDSAGDPAFSFTAQPPPGLTAVSWAGSTLQLWPFTGLDLAGTPSDPMNVLFAGDVDVVSLRSALLALDGDRTAFLPPGPPFDCTWADAFGDIQTTYSDGDGWVGNPVQLQCGDYNPLRIHLRLFPAGDWVLGGAHFELLIPQTTEHEILSWEIAELVVTIDLLRSGLLAAAPSAAPVNPVPSYRATRAAVYNGLPPSLIALLTAFHGPQPPQPVATDVPIPSDGLATILYLGSHAPLVAKTASASFRLDFDQVIPRPFCATGPADIVLVQGPVDFTYGVSVTPAGALSSHGTATGELLVTPIDPATMQPSGPSFRALVRNNHFTEVGPAGSSVNSRVSRQGLPPSSWGSLMSHLVTAPNRGAHFTKREAC